MEEASSTSFIPTFYYDDECITVCLPLEYRVMRNYQIRGCMDWVIASAYGRPVPLKNARTLIRFISSPECLAERRSIVSSEAGIRVRKVLPQEFSDAMALHPGLRKCLDGMAFAVCDRPSDGTITRSDYLSHTIIISEDVFDDDDRLLRTYVVFRELASCLCVHPMGVYGMQPIPHDVMKFMDRFPNWMAYERKCNERGWRFRYGVIV